MIDISGNLPDAPVNAFAVDNNFSNRLYLGSDVGMYVSFDTGQSWEVLGEGLPILPIGDIKFIRLKIFLLPELTADRCIKLILIF